MANGRRTRLGARPVRTVARACAGLAAAAALTSAAACGDSDLDVTTPAATDLGASGLPTGLPTALPTGLPTTLPTDLPDVGDILGSSAAGEAIPADFPVPPGAKASPSSVGGNDVLTLTGVSADDAVAFYRDALPRAGYEIVSDSGGGGAVPATIAFTGEGVAGAVSGADTGSGESTVVIAFSKIP